MTDYQPFAAFYSIDSVSENGDPILYGSPKMHHHKCCDGVYCIILAKDEEDRLFGIDVKGEFLCDFGLFSADSQTNILKYMNTGEKSSFHPVTQQILSFDESENLDAESIVLKRAGIMSKEFLGFIPAHVFMVRPELEENFQPGNWAEIYNPEFF